MVNRGPQFVQFVNGYRWRRSAGSENSRAHSGQVAMSGGIVESAIPSRRLDRIVNPGIPVGALLRTEKRVRLAAGGISGPKRARKRESAAAFPSRWMTTLPGVFSTHPASPHREASRWTNGRNPTP